MNRRPIRLAFVAVLAVALFPAVALEAATSTPDFNWTGGTSTWWNDGGNWAGGVAPDTGGTANVIFSGGTMNQVNYYEINVFGLSFNGITQPFAFGGSYDTTHLGAGGINYLPTQPFASTVDDAIQLESSQTWNIASGSVAVHGNISDFAYVDTLWTSQNYRLTKAGAGTLTLGTGYNSSYNWGGGITLTEGTVVAQADPYAMSASNPTLALGFGTITFNGGTLRTAKNSYANGYGGDQAFFLTNRVVSNGLISLENGVTTRFTTNGDDNGLVVFNADTTLKLTGRPLFIESDIVQDEGETGSARRLTFAGPGMAVLTGNNRYTGGTEATGGRLIFGHANAIPANALASTAAGDLTASGNGYIGLGDDLVTANVQGLFLDNFNKAATTGTVGFDSDPAGNPTDFSGAVDLTGFAASARLGSATHAVLSGPITPQGSDYRFGGGGGWLQVDSALTGDRGLVLDSPAAWPLTLRLTNADGNTFTGDVQVTNSALIFANHTLPPTTNPWKLGPTGYIGSEGINPSTADPAAAQTTQIADYLKHFDPGTTGGMIGLDAPPGGSRTIAGDINLADFTGAVFLGSATPGYTDDGVSGGIRLQGTVTPGNNGTAPYRFGAYKGGLLIVESNLPGTAGIKIGDPVSPATFGDYTNQVYSKVALLGDNSGQLGDITFSAGELYVGKAATIGGNVTTSLGSGNLIVQAMAVPVEWQSGDGSPPALQLSGESGLIIPNAVMLQTRLNLTGYGNLELAGTIHGPGALYLNENATLTLSNGANDFTGGIYLSNSSKLYVNADHATGAGPLQSGGSYTSEVVFHTDRPAVGGLESTNYGYLTLEAEQAVLTVDQASDATFSGQLRTASESGAARLVKDGSAQLTLENGGLYFNDGTYESALDASVSLQINEGTLVVGNGFYVNNSASTIWVHGGTLELDGRGHLASPLVLDPGARLAGNGSFSQSVSIRAGAVLAPGVAGAGETGTLNFTHLELNGGGIYEWQLQAAAPDAASGHDFVSIYNYLNTAQTLVVNATADDRFTLKIISLGLGGAAGMVQDFDPSQAYRWAVFGFDALDGFDPAKFTLDTSQFANRLAFDARGNGSFSLELAGDTQLGGELVLNFTPVPEPSTYLLLIAGLAFILLSLRGKTPTISPP